MNVAPPLALSVSPTRLVVPAGASRELELVNGGAAPATVEARPASYAVSLRGRPRILVRPPALAVRPRRVVVPAGGSARLTVEAPPRARPGDHPALVLVATRAAGRAVGVSVRIGVVVLVRGAGRVVHHIVPLALRRRGGWLELTVRNDGNVAERLTQATVRVRLPPRGRGRVEPRELLPHTRGIVRVRIRGRVPPRVVVRILGRTYRLRQAGRR